MAKPPTTARVAKLLHKYIKDRAAVENKGFDLDVGFFRGGINLGCVSFFGVQLNGHRMIRDEQEPWEGYFDAWMEKHGKTTTDSA